MKHKFSYRHASIVLGISAVLLGGCKQTEVRPAYQSPLLGAKDESGILSDRQVADVQISFARALQDQGDLERAAAAYREAIKRNPKQAEAFQRLAILYDHQGKFDTSAGLFRQALKLAPANPDIYCDIGYSLYVQGRWNEAEMNLRQAIALWPDHVRAHNNLGLVLAHINRHEEALAEFHRAGCTSAEGHMNVAFVLSLDHRWDEAREEYRRVLAANPSSEKAQSRLRQLDELIAKVDPEWQPMSHLSRILPASLDHYSGEAREEHQRGLAADPSSKKAQSRPEFYSTAWEHLSSRLRELEVSTTKFDPKWSPVSNLPRILPASWDDAGEENQRVLAANLSSENAQSRLPELDELITTADSDWQNLPRRLPPVP